MLQKIIKNLKEEVSFYISYIYNFIQTTVHKYYVAKFIWIIIFQLGKRSIAHDLSKYSNKEALEFSKYIFDLKTKVYGSTEYKNMLEKIRPCLNHHYSLNSHHPQFYKNGFKDMSFLDRVEMVADWIASTRRNKNGNIMKSLDLNQERFDYNNNDIEWLTLIVKDINVDLS